jgi:hypothetical protein
MEGTMARKRRQYTGEEKLAILRKHLLEGVAVYNTQRLRSAIGYIIR